MKTKTSKKNSSRNTKKKATSKKSSQPSIKERIGSLFNGDALGFIVGLVLMVFVALMIVSMVSNFSTGGADQAGIQSGTLVEAKNQAGKLGAYLSYFLMNRCFGVFSFCIAFFLLIVSLRLMKAYKMNLWFWFFHLSIVMIWSSVAISAIWDLFNLQEVFSSISFPLGGLHGEFIYNLLKEHVGSPIAIVILVGIAIMYLTYLSQKTIEYVRLILHPIHKKEKAEENYDTSDSLIDGRKEADSEPDEDYEEAPDDEEDDEEELDIPEEETVPVEPISSDDTLSDNDFTVRKAEEEVQADGTVVAPTDVVLERYDPRKDFEHYKFPTLELLDKFDQSDAGIDMNEQGEKKNRIIDVLRSFGVEIESVVATVGPTITLYEIKPAKGIKISKIRGLEDDIALSLSALGIRIIAPIPGKGTIGIEVPNRKPNIVSMESILNSKKFQDTKFELPIALGKTITNEVFMVDLAKMPHLLVAGATGQGKSVGLNALITSLLYKKHPSELKFVMVDPKKVEFSIYGPLEKYFIAMMEDQDEPIITDVHKVIQTLKSLCTLMDHRYDLLKKARVRNIKEYNEKFVTRRLNPKEGHEYMPYIVIVIDEFGDLIMTAGKEIELPIARIAQLARAVGMHMVIATQRPTTNIITGTIKANFPARMAFKVSSIVDSRTILDRKGADQLVGKGDMLFLSGQSGSDPVRVQCAFVDTPEVERITEFISEQHGYLPPYVLPEADIESGDISGASGGGNGLDSHSLDDMFEDVARLVVVHQSGSTSLIQRKFSIGYNRAGRLMDQLERAGIVGPAQGSKPRDVLCADETQLQQILQEIKGY